jgi:hypothetical protein
VELRDSSGAVVERAVASNLTHGVVVTCHGGPATRAELTRMVGGEGRSGGATGRPGSPGIVQAWSMVGGATMPPCTDACANSGSV